MGRDSGLSWPLKKKKKNQGHWFQCKCKRAHPPAIKPLWPSDSVGEKQKCQYRVPKCRNIPAVTPKTLSFGKNKKVHHAVYSSNNPDPSRIPSLPCFYQTRVSPCPWFLLTGDGLTTAPQLLKVPFCCRVKTKQATVWDCRPFRQNSTNFTAKPDDNRAF